MIHLFSILSVFRAGGHQRKGKIIKGLKTQKRAKVFAQAADFIVPA
ncbi:hypothetical protein HMPREF1863_00261 [Aedoeadaptatus coxii]|uniref:Uncharacterized protein n=1 Tax=Aedoeadaptatus coxii TaxID=755172 RepID=A0A134AL19_9FIRM|nr:hypothetical protein HMPREF1863_00261 [Peptoniphilus coxii]